MSKVAMALLSILALLSMLSMPTMAEANPTPYLESEMRITSSVLIGPVKGKVKGTQYDFYFEGVVGGPNVVGGTMEGVDHYIFDLDGIGHIDAYAMITDGDGDIIESRVTGLNPPGNPSGAYYPFVDAEATVTGATGKYLALVGSTFVVEGFFSDLTRLHMIWYYP